MESPSWRPGKSLVVLLVLGITLGGGLRTELVTSGSAFSCWRAAGKDGILSHAQVVQALQHTCGRNGAQRPATSCHLRALLQPAQMPQSMLGIYQWWRMR